MSANSMAPSRVFCPAASVAYAKVHESPRDCDLGRMVHRVCSSAGLATDEWKRGIRGFETTCAGSELTFDCRALSSFHFLQDRPKRLHCTGLEPADRGAQAEFGCLHLLTDFTASGLPVGQLRVVAYAEAGDQLPSIYCRALVDRLLQQFAQIGTFDSVSRDPQTHVQQHRSGHDAHGNQEDQQIFEQLA